MNIKMTAMNLMIGITVALGHLESADAGDCWPVLQNHLIWAQSDEFSLNHHVTFQMVSNNSNAAYASYASGVLDVTSGDPWLFTTGSGRTGSHDAIQYFSDRTYPDSSPFNRNAVDILGVQITWWGYVTFTLKSWGNGQMTGTGDCTNDMLVVDIGNTKFVFSFKDTASSVIH
jgi:hypothetical protein